MTYGIATAPRTVGEFQADKQGNYFMICLENKAKNIFYDGESKECAEQCGYKQPGAKVMITIDFTKNEIGWVINGKVCDTHVASISLKDFDLYPTIDSF